MRVCFLGRYNPTEILSGPEKVAKRVFSGIKKINDETVFIEYFFDGKRYSYWKKLFGFEVVAVDNGLQIIRAGLLRTIIFLLKFKPEIIHIITFERFAAVAFVYKIFAKVKICYTVHGLINFENTFFRDDLSSFYKVKDKIVEKLIFRFADKIFFLSERIREQASKYFNLTKRSISIVANGIDEVFTKVVNPGNKPAGKLKLVFVGSDRKEKGFPLLAEALTKIDFEVDLFLIEGYTVPSSIRNAKVTVKNVSKMPTEKFAEFLEEKDIFISASNYEPFSISAVEAMAAGLVVVATKATGMSRFISDSCNGFVIDSESSSQLTNILAKLNSNMLLLDEIKMNARKIFTELSWSQIARQYFS